MNIVKEDKTFLDHSLINDSDADILTFFQDHDAGITKALEQSLLRFGKIKVNFIMQIILSKFTPRHEVVIDKPKSKPKWSSRLLSAVKAVPKVLKLLSQYVTSKVKSYFKTEATVDSPVDDDTDESRDTIHVTVSFQTDANDGLILNAGQIAKTTKAASHDLERRLAHYMRDGSGWTFGRIQSFSIHSSKYKPFRGSSYLKTPPDLASKKAIINVQNADNRCFGYAVLSAIFPMENNAQRPSHYNKYFDTLRFDGINFPVELSSIRKFEKLNKDLCVTCQHRNCNDESHVHGIAVYVFEWKKDGLSPLRISDCNGYKIRLMLLHEADKWHYIFIKNFHRLLTQMSKYKGTRFWCDNACV